MKNSKQHDLEKLFEDIGYMNRGKCKQFLRSIYISTFAKIMVSIIIMQKSKLFTISAITVAVLLGMFIVQMPAMILVGSASGSRQAATSPPSPPPTPHSPLNTIFKQVRELCCSDNE